MILILKFNYEAFSIFEVKWVKHSALDNTKYVIRNKKSWDEPNNPRKWLNNKSRDLISVRLQWYSLRDNIAREICIVGKIAS